MKKFQEVLKEKAHLNKIKNAKKTVPATSKTIISKMATSKVNDEAQLLLKLYQNKSYESIPAYKLLRTAGLQQYTKGFILRGYGINLSKLALLADDDRTKFFEDLKVLPGHSVKLQKIIKTIAKQSYQQVLEGSQLNQTFSVNKEVQKDKTIYSNLSRKRTSEEDKEYEKQLQRVLNEYTPQIGEQKNKTSKTQKKSNMLATGQQTKYKTKYLPPKAKPVEPANTYVDFRKKALQTSTKQTIRKSTTIPTQKQLKGTTAKQQSAKEALSRLLQGISSQSVVQSKKVMEIDLQINKIKDLYRSFDGAVMSSTIANLDIEELVYAFAGYVGSRVVAAEQKHKTSEKQIKTQNDSSQQTAYMQNIKFPLNANEEDSLDNQEGIEEEIGEILRESYLHPLYREAIVTENIDCDAHSEGSNQEQQQQLTGNQFESTGERNNDTMMMESSFLGGESFNFGMSKPLEIFDEPEPSDIDYFKPTVDSIFNFIKNIVLSAKMQRQIPVMAASYLQAFLQQSRIVLTSVNYKRLLVTCLLLASKVWDDESFETPSFSKTFPEYSTILLNEMQKQLLKFLNYKLKIDKRQYALMYFKLRKYIKKNIKSYQNRKLNIKLIRELQSGVRNEYRNCFLTKRNSF